MFYAARPDRLQPPQRLHAGKEEYGPPERASPAFAPQYRPDQANGRLPLQISAESVGCTRLILGGQLELDGKGGLGLSLRVSEECEGSRTGEAPAPSGTYRLEGSRLLLDAGSAGVLKGEAASPSSVTLTLRSLVLVFSLGEDDPLEAAAELVRRQTEQLAARQPPRYDCTTDSLLSRLPMVPAADTAGLGHQIAAAFHGYRLSTQSEIACRHAEPDFDPETLWGRYGAAAGPGGSGAATAMPTVWTTSSSSSPMKRTQPVTCSSCSSATARPHR
jgi:hypothetical protein